MFEALVQNNGGGNTSVLGAVNDEEFAALQKALSAGYGTDESQLTGGAALRVQSLDKTMQATIVENKHFKLFNRMPKPKVGATVDEWTEMSQIGGFLGGSVNSESGIIAQQTGTYNRRVGLVKYLMTQRSITLVQSMQTTITASEAVEYNAGAKQLLSDAEYLSFEGNSACQSLEFDGIEYQIVSGVNAGQVDPGNYIDVQGAPLSSVSAISDAAAQIAGFGNYGTPTDLFISQLTQSDLDKNLDPAFRVALDSTPNSTNLGAPVKAINTSWGNIASNADIFVRDGKQKQPFELQYAALAASLASQAPSSVVCTVANDAASQFTAQRAGTYYYYVTGQTASGQSTGVISAQVAVASGQSVTVTIGRSASQLETCYVISRSRLNGGNVVAGSVPGQGSDFRECIRVPVSGGATTVYLDQCRDIPGTAKAFMLNLSPSDTAINWRQLMPMLKFQLYPTNSAIIPWAQLLFGYLRISKRKHHVVFKNILCSGEVWRPFNV